jgi:hypothetical protein
MSQEHSERTIVELLRTRARERIDAGQLPTQLPVRSFAGPGSSKLCCLCDSAIVAPDIEFELDFDKPGALGRMTIRLHARCYDSWDAERVGTHCTSGNGVRGLRMDPLAGSRA